MSDMIKDEFGGWMFTEDDRTALADILKAKFDSKQIDNFIVLLQWICFQMKIWQDLPSGPKIKKKADPLLKSLKKTINHLLWLEKGQLANKIALKKTIDNISLFEKGQYANGITNFGFPHFVGSDFDSWDNLGQGSTVAWDHFVDSDFDSLDNRHKSRHVYSIIKNTVASRISLEELKSLIERQLQAWINLPTHPSADSHSHVFDMAKRYFEIFHEMPTTTVEGTFYNVVTTAYETVKLPFDFPERKIRQAIKKLKVTIAH